MAEENYIWVLGDKLPTVYDVGISIHSVCKKYSSKKMKSVISSYGTALRKLWINAFGDNHVLGIKSIREKLHLVMKDYERNVYLKTYPKTYPNKPHLNKPGVSKRLLNETWQEMTVPFKNNESKIKDLFDIGINTDELVGREREFYKLQSTTREGRISLFIDEEYEAEVEIKRANAEIARNREELEHSFSNPDEYMEVISEPEPANLNVSVNRSGCSRTAVSVNSIGIQVDIMLVTEQPIIRHSKVCTDKIKTSLAKVSVVAGISPQTSRLACQTFAKEFYGHIYYIDPKEKNPEHQAKRPKNNADYYDYKDVFPSNKTIAYFKHDISLKREFECATSLKMKREETKAILHFDTTKRCRIEGDWPSLIIDLRSPPKLVYYIHYALFFSLLKIEEILQDSLLKPSIACLLPFNLLQNYYGRKLMHS